ncbi:MAG: septation protein SpoVG family protein [Candidatus Omnitrophota bacterium]
MEVTEIRIFIKEGQDKKLKGYSTVTFDNSFVVRNIKIIQGTTGVFIAMPSRKLKKPCGRCSFKNEIGSKYCNQCGVELPPVSEEDLAHDAKTDHRDIAHPISQEFRDYLQSQILQAYQAEVANILV